MYIYIFICMCVNVKKGKLDVTADGVNCQQEKRGPNLERQSFQEGT